MDSLERLHYASSLLGIDLLQHHNIAGVVDSTDSIVGNSRRVDVDEHCVDVDEHGVDVNHSIINQTSDVSKKSDDRDKSSRSIDKYSLSALTKKFSQCHASSSLLPPKKSAIQAPPSSSSTSSSSPPSLPSNEDRSRVFRHVVGLDAEWKAFNAGSSGGCSILQVTHTPTPT